MLAARPFRFIVIALFLAAPALLAEVAAALDPAKYVLPPKNIVDVFDAEPLPQVLISPSRQVVALTKARTYPRMVELSRPMYRLAGSRMKQKNKGPHRSSGLPGTGIYSITLKKIAGGAETPVPLPSDASVTAVKFSPDGAKLAFLNVKDSAIELWVADAMTGAAKAIVTGSDRINETTGDPCDWEKDNVTLVCKLVAPGRGAVPPEPTVPLGPNVQENYGKAAPAPTYEDLLKTVHDDQLFEYYFTSQLYAINTSTGANMAMGRPAAYENVTPSPP